MFANIQDIVTEEMFLTALLAITVCVALWRIKKNTRP
jgi:ABC-type enterochelin transport system permease subunit